MKLKPTAILVALFIALLIFATYDARATDGFRISLGKTVVNSATTYGEVGYEWRGLEFTAAQSGVGQTENGPQEEVAIFSASYLVRPNWYFLGARNYYRIGVAHVNGSPLVGDTNFRLGIGLEWDVVQLEYFHFSSAGIHQPNTGIDGVQLRFLF